MEWRRKEDIGIGQGNQRLKGHDREMRFQLGAWRWRGGNRSAMGSRPRYDDVDHAGVVSRLIVFFEWQRGPWSTDRQTSLLYDRV